MERGEGLSPVVGPLADAWERLKWADIDAEAVRTLGLDLMEADLYRLSVKFDGQRGEIIHSCLADPAIEAEALRQLSRPLGSYLDNVRAALNYLSYQLALLALRKDPSLEDRLKPERVEFPIFSDPERFREQNRIKNLPLEYRQALEAVQPYDGRNPGLWILHELGREQRHRLIHSTPLVPIERKCFVEVGGVVLPAKQVEVIRHSRLKDNDPVMRFWVERPVAAVDVQPGFTIAIGIDHALCHGLDILEVLEMIRDEAAPLFRSIEAQFFAETGWPGL